MVLDLGRGYARDRMRGGRVLFQVNALERVGELDERRRDLARECGECVVQYHVASVTMLGRGHENAVLGEGRSCRISADTESPTGHHVSAACRTVQLVAIARSQACVELRLASC